MAIVVETLMAEDLERGINTTAKTHPGGGVLNGHQISLSSFSTVGAAGTAPTSTWDPPDVDSAKSVSTTIPVTGAALGDFVLASFSLDLEGLSLSAYVSSSSVVTVVLGNLTGTQQIIASGTLRVLVFKTR